MKLSLPYGGGTVELAIGGYDELPVTGDRYPPPLDDPRAAVRAALDHPAASDPLGDIVPRRGRTAVLISDPTRGGGLGPLLLELLSYLEDRGAGPDRVEIFIATGLHGSCGRGGLVSHLGDEIVSRWRVLEHDATDSTALTQVGSGESGEPYLFNERVVDAELVIAFGTVSFHYFAGFGGGRKLVLPGVAGERTILANHRRSLADDPGAGPADGCRSGNLAGNPVHEDMLEGARMMPTPVFAVNLVQGGSGTICFVNAGDLERSHLAACAYLDEHFRIPLERRFKAVICSAGGAPRDVNLLQSHKALRHASNAVEEGGLLLAAASCPEGVGSPSLEAAFREGRGSVREGVRKRYTLNAQAAISILDLSSRYSVYLKSSLESGAVSRFGFCSLEDEYIDILLNGLRADEILVVRDAASFLPVTER